MAADLQAIAAELADRYRIVRELGAGGMATVYLADDLRHKRQVALKVLRDDLTASLGTERFLREVTIAAGAVAWLRQIFERGVLAQGNPRRDARGVLLRAIASARSVRNWTTSGSSRLRTRATRSPRTSSARSPHADAHSIAHGAHLIARPRDLTRCCGLRQSPAVPERDIPGP